MPETHWVRYTRLNHYFNMTAMARDELARTAR